MGIKEMKIYLIIITFIVTAQVPTLAGEKTETQCNRVLNGEVIPDGEINSQLFNFRSKNGLKEFSAKNGDNLRLPRREISNPVITFPSIGDKAFRFSNSLYTTAVETYQATKQSDGSYVLKCIVPDDVLYKSLSHKF